FLLGKGYPRGEYVVTFDAPAGTPPAGVTFARSLVLPKGANKRVAKLSATEPVLRVNPGISPSAGGPTAILSVQANNLVDPNDQTGSVDLQLGHIALDGVELQPDQVTVKGTV